MRSKALPLALILAAPAVEAADVTRTLNVALSGDAARPFAVENLLGTMRVVPGSGEGVTAVAVVHAESEALAGSIRFEQVVGEHGVPTLRVRYPVDRYDTYRSPSKEEGDGGNFLGFFFGGHNNLKYDGARVSVSAHSGVRVHAEVEVRLPRRAVDAKFLQRVGPLEGHDVSGKLWFDTSSGTVTLEHVEGDLVADTGSGDVHASGIGGSLRCDTGSGVCAVDSFKGDRLSCDTGSGEVRLRAVESHQIHVDTGSGEVRIEEADADDVDVDTGSGGVAIQSGGGRLRRVKADTGSGDVRLRLGADAGFEARADVGSGDIVSHFPDAQPIVKRREIVGYRRGDGRIQIDVDTGSGDLVLEPGI
jgi:hypothetical protein